MSVSSWRNGAPVMGANPRILCAKKYKPIPRKNLPAVEIFKRHCAGINKFAEAHGLPWPDTKGLFAHCDLKKELGAGAYGSVFKTEDPNVVLKLTSDESEAHFIQTAMHLYLKGVKSAGMVEYFGIGALREKHENHRVFVTWREYATEVELPCGKSRVFEDFCFYVDAFLDKANRLRNRLFAAFHQYGTSAAYWRFVENDEETQHFLEGLKGEARQLANSSDAAKKVGDALGVYIDHGIVIADAHTGNIGAVERQSGRQTWTIVDPGHAVVLDKKMCAEEIPVVH